MPLQRSQNYVEKFGPIVNRSPFKFFMMVGQSSEPCLVLPKFFSSYPTMDPSGCFAIVRTRLGCWKIWCVRDNQGVIFVGPCWDSFYKAHTLYDCHLIQFEYYDDLKYDATLFWDQIEEEDEEEDEDEDEEEDEDTDDREDVDGLRMLEEIYNQFKFPPIVTFRPTMSGINIPNESNRSMPRLYIDNEIWKPHCLSKYKVAWLRTPMHGTRIWEVNLQLYKDKGLSVRKNPRLALGKGWTNFCVDNNLKEGDNIDMHFVELKGHGVGVDVLHILVELNVGN
ncbi:hypothetical protein ACJIZ3_025265 [Penstemon smallii]|uniref:TF-B3 domain-containing protein n=1 Tax=Penstemon smallii TaxID=265156 RepID=A0ABD3TU39_9LAMI